MKRKTMHTLIGSRVQRDPTPTPTPALDQIAIPPTPTSSVRPPTPTPGSFVAEPTATSTPERVPDEPTETPPREIIAATEPVEPTATQPIITQPEPEGETHQQFPCGPPYNPFGWLCWPGASGPSFPVFPPRDVSAATGIHWYGVRMSNPMGDATTEANWGMEGVAWSLDGREVSRCSLDSSEGTYRWRLSDAQADIEGAFAFERDAEQRLLLAGEIDGQPFVVPVGRDRQSTDDAGPLSLERTQEDLIGQWIPLFHDLDGLLELAAPTGDGGVQGPGGCAVFGFWAGATCLGIGPIGCYFIIDAAHDVCGD